MPGLRGHVCPDYPPYDISIADNKRVDAWLEEFRRFEKDGGLPRLNIVRLGNDHTAGTSPGRPTPRARSRAGQGVPAARRAGTG